MLQRIVGSADSLPNNGVKRILVSGAEEGIVGNGGDHNASPVLAQTAAASWNRPSPPRSFLAKPEDYRQLQKF